MILTERSSPERHLKQSDIISMLEKYPYEISIERKALGRIIHGLADSELGIFFSRNDGCWFDRYESRAA